MRNKMEPWRALGVAIVFLISLVLASTFSNEDDL